MSQDTGDEHRDIVDSVDDALLSQVTSSAPDVVGLSAASRSALWALVQKRTVGVTAVDVDSSMAASGTHQVAPSRRRGFVPTGVVGRSVLALAACSAALAVGVAVWPSHSSNELAVSEAFNTNPAAPSTGTLTDTQLSSPSTSSQSEMERNATSASLAAAADAQSKKSMDVCMAADEIMILCGTAQVLFGTEVPLTTVNVEGATPVSGPSEHVAMTVAEPVLTEDADGMAVWSVAVSVNNTSDNSYALISPLTLGVFPATATHESQECTQQSRVWRVGGSTVSDVTSFPSGTITQLTVTAVCADDTDGRPPRVRAQVTIDPVESDIAVFADRL